MRLFSIIFYLFSILLIVFGYKIYKKGKTQIISLKPEMTRYCKTNHYYTSYDRINCLKTLSDVKINVIPIENITLDFEEEFKKVHIDHNLEYQKYKIQKNTQNDKIRQLNTLYMLHHFGQFNQLNQLNQ